MSPVLDPVPEGAGPCCTSASATRLAPPNTFSYSRYTFMYSCFNGTILLKPASTTMREAEPTKSTVRIEKTTSHTLRWSKTIRETEAMKLSRLTSAFGRGGDGHGDGARLAQQQHGVGPAQQG